ncbi:hypothetical protein J19TS2_18840 [Cohnella xylanilytica]|nr:hypothetical protein J19TS2_18840 [Cohnella xylanilytica]
MGSACVWRVFGVRVDSSAYEWRASFRMPWRWAAAGSGANELRRRYFPKNAPDLNLTNPGSAICVFGPLFDRKFGK